MLDIKRIRANKEEVIEIIILIKLLNLMKKEEK